MYAAARRRDSALDKPNSFSIAKSESLNKFQLGRQTASTKGKELQAQLAEIKFGPT